MVYRSMKRASWVLITLLPLTFILNVDGGRKKTHKTTPIPQIATTHKTPENGSSTPGYEMYYYEYPDGIFLNGTFNDTYGIGDYYDDYYGGYLGYYAYPEYYEYYNDNSTQNIEPTLMTTKRHRKGTKRPKTKPPRRKTRSLAENSERQHLCLMNLIKMVNFSDQYIPYTFECKGKGFKHFACLNSDGFIKPCFMLKDEKKPGVYLCAIKEENTSYVTTCNSPEPQNFCFVSLSQTNRMIICKDLRLRICLNGNLTICNNQEKKQVQAVVGIENVKSRSEINKQTPQIFKFLKSKKPVILSLTKDIDQPDANKRVWPGIVIPSKDKDRPDANKRVRRGNVIPSKDKDQPGANKRVRRGNVIPSKDKDQPDANKPGRRGKGVPSKDENKPDVNCSNCEVEVRMIVDETVDHTPKVHIKVSDWDSEEKLDDFDPEFGDK